jgi:putative pyruvate formate lyase activating enzyme
VIPPYVDACSSGLIHRRIETAWGQLSSCRLCPRRCKKNRLANETGYCRTTDKAVVASYGPHFGEEAPLVGSHGSGTIFFGHCNLGCVFCQNYDISHEPDDAAIGERVDHRQLAEIMVELQRQGCHNINFVTPTHVVPQILQALPAAVEMGLRLPLIYNSSGYDEVETLKLLDGIIDIYMPDFKFWNPSSAARYTGAGNYPRQAIKAIQEMHRQVGVLFLNQKGVAQRGLLIRHLIMPGLLQETRRILHFIARKISPDTYVNIMGQYHPCGHALDFPEINRTISAVEYGQALHYAEEAALTRLDQPDLSRLLARLMM